MELKKVGVQPELEYLQGIDAVSYVAKAKAQCMWIT
jgi:hypothetical protein